MNFSETVDTATPEELVLEFDFNNSFLVHAGIEKPFWEDTVVRFGYMYDHSPVPDKSTGPLFPDSNRHSVTLGASKAFGNMEMTFFYQAMKFTDRVTNVPENDNIFTNGRYDNFAHLGGLGLRINLGGASLENR